jgi:sugar/nucleoside kinase (ribokinase family)
MKPILVSGLINLETTLKIEEFPLDYFPVTFNFGGLNDTVSGVGYNVAKALHTLGSEVCLVSMHGRDPVSQLVLNTLQQDGFDTSFILPRLDQLPRSVVLYDKHGRRQIHLDLKTIQDEQYPPDLFTQALSECALAIMSTVNFNRNLLPLVREAGLPIAVDVQAISDLHDDYNRDFMAAADILFISNENLPLTAEKWAQAVFDIYPAQIVGIGRGAQGAFLALRDGPTYTLPAATTRPLVNTIGAGDALFSAFIHFYAQGVTPQEALRRAIVFASYKIGATGASEGFLSASALEAWL